MEKYILESKLITDKQWQEYQNLKRDKRATDDVISYFKYRIKELKKENKQLKSKINKLEGNNE